MPTLKKYVLPESKIVGFVRHSLQWDIQIVASYSFEEFMNLYLVAFVLIETSEIPAELKEEKLKEYYSRYQKTIPNE